MFGKEKKRWENSKYGERLKVLGLGICRVVQQTDRASILMSLDYFDLVLGDDTMVACTCKQLKYTRRTLRHPVELRMTDDNNIMHTIWRRIFDRAREDCRLLTQYTRFDGGNPDGGIELKRTPSVPPVCLLWNAAEGFPCHGTQATSKPHAARHWPANMSHLCTRFRMYWTEEKICKAGAWRWQHPSSPSQKPTALRVCICKTQSDRFTCIHLNIHPTGTRIFSKRFGVDRRLFRYVKNVLI